MASSPKGEVTPQIGSPLILTCEVMGLPAEVNSGLLVQWMKRGSVGSSVLTGGVEVLSPSFPDLFKLLSPNIVMDVKMKSAKLTHTNAVF